MLRMNLLRRMMNIYEHDNNVADSRGMRYRFCASLRSRSTWTWQKGHSMRTFAGTMLAPRVSTWIKHLSLKNPSMWTRCLGKKRTHGSSVAIECDFPQHTGLGQDSGLAHHPLGTGLAQHSNSPNLPVHWCSQSFGKGNSWAKNGQLVDGAHLRFWQLF